MGFWAARIRLGAEENFTKFIEVSVVHRNSSNDAYSKFRKKPSDERKNSCFEKALKVVFRNYFVIYLAEISFKIFNNFF